VGAILNPDALPSLTDEERAAREEHRTRLHAAIFELLVPGYQQGSFALEDFCARLVAVAARAHPEDRWIVNRWVGEALDQASKHRPRSALRRGKRPASQAERKTMADLARLIHEREGLPLTPEGAFTRTVQVFRKAGLNNITAHSVDKAVFPRRRSKGRTAK
jgi:hypothetical protein